MRFLLFLGIFSFLLLGPLQAQTRKIGHRSHSGAAMTFAMLLDDDHLGLSEPSRRQPNYEVEPFVARIRKHYEKIAKQIPAVNVELPPSADAPNGTPAADTNQTKVPSKGNQTQQLKSKPKAPETAATEISSPEFLVQTQRKAEPITAHPTNPNRPSRGIWLLLGLLAFPVAPGVFLASAAMQRKRLPA
jgi:hypothetical protein